MDSILDSLVQLINEEPLYAGAGIFVSGVILLASLKTLFGNDEQNPIIKSAHPKWVTTINLDHQSKIIPGTENGERIRVNAQCISPASNSTDVNDWIITDNPKFKTIYEMWKNSVKEFGNKKYLGTVVGGQYEWLTYEDMEKKSSRLAGAFKNVLTESKSMTQNFGVLASNSYHWNTCFLAAIKQKGLCMVPMYDTLGDQAMKYITELCEFETIFIDNMKRLTTVLNMLDNIEHKTVKNLVLFTKIEDKFFEIAKSKGVKLYTIQDLVKDCEPVDDVVPDEDDHFLFCFTSGTTGNPKGVVTTHKAWVCLTISISCIVPSEVFGDTEKSWLSYLPAAHIFELASQVYITQLGGHIGFFGGNPKNLISDVAALKPSLFGGVPRVWNKIYDKMMSARDSSAVSKFMLDWALKGKLEYTKKGINTRNTIYDKIVFKKIQNLLGGNINFAVSGAAPLKNNVLNTIRAALGCQVTEAYGQTECCGVGTSTAMGDTSSSVGAPAPTIAIKLESVPDMNYLAENDAGEICLKGPTLMKCYYKNPEKTAETIDKDGWLHTGDIGMWLPNGTLKIVDRKKHIFKISQGEYIAPEKIENVYLNNSAIAQCFVYGNGFKSCLVGLVFLDPDLSLPYFKSKHNISEPTVAALAKNPKVYDILMKEMDKLAVEDGLKGFEKVKKIMIKDKIMTLEEGLLTPTQKVKRAVVEKHFASDFDKLYEGGLGD